MVLLCCHFFHFNFLDSLISAIRISLSKFYGPKKKKKILRIFISFVNAVFVGARPELWMAKDELSSWHY